MLTRLLLPLLLATSLHASEVTRAGRWELHSSFWMNLHQTLMHDASARSPRDLSALSEEEKAAWTDAVARYRDAAPGGNPTFARPMMDLQDELTQVADDAVEPAISNPLGSAIREAAAAYRAHWWRQDDIANRFLLGYMGAMLRDAGEELAAGHEAVYHQPFPGSIRVDVCAYGGTFGAQLHPLRHGHVVTVSSRDYGNHGLTALEIVLHESSHAIVFPDDGAVADAISAASKKAGMEPPRDLWHAILFATSSELTRRALVARGATGYVPMSKDLLTRAWPQYREAIETEWMPYLSGKGTLEEAISKVVAALKVPAKQ